MRLRFLQIQRVLAQGVCALLLLFVASSALANNYTNSVFSGGYITPGDNEVLTNPASLISGNISNGGTIQFWQSILLTNQGVISGSGALYQNGSGTTFLASSNTYTGSTLLNAGVLRAGSTQAFGVNSAVSLSTNAGTTLDLNGYNNSIGTLSGGGSGGGSITLGAGTLTVGGAITSTNYYGYNASAISTYAGNISGSGGFTKVGTGVEVLTGSNSYSGLTTVSSGVLMLSNTTGPALYNGGSGTISVAYNGAGGNNQFSGGLIFGAANQLGTNVDLLLQAPYNWSYVQLNGFNQTIGNLISGSTNPSSVVIENIEFGPQGGATLTVTQTTNSTFSGYIRDGFSGAGPFSITKNGAATLTLSGNNITYTGSTTVNQGTLVVSGLLGSGGSYAGAITDNSSLVFSNSATQSLSGNLTGSGTFTMAGTGTTVLAMTRDTLTGPKVVNSGVLQLSGGSTNSGATGVSSFIIGNGGTLRSTGVYWFNGNPSFTFTTNGGGTIDTYSSGNFVMGGNGTYTSLGGSQNQITGSTGINLNGYTQIFNVTRGTDSNSDLLVSAAIWNSGGINKTGNGTMTLSGNNSYSGGTTVSAGTLVMDLSQMNTTKSFYANTVASGASMILYNTNPVFENAGSFLTSNSFAGAGTLAKTGAGFLEFWSGSTFTNFTGQLDVRQGTLAINNLGTGATMSNAVLNIGSGATFDDRYNSALVVDQLTGSGTLTHSFSDSLTVTVGAANGSSTFTGSITQPNGTFGLTKVGTGTLTLAGNNSYSGFTTVSNGVLRAGSTTAFAPYSYMTLATNGGAVLDLNGYNNSVGSLSGGGSVTLGTGTLTLGGAVSTVNLGAVNTSAVSTYSGNISGAGGLTKIGTGYQVLSGSNTYSGLTTVSSGVLMLSNTTGPALYNGGSGTISVAYNGAQGNNFYTGGLMFGAANQLGTNVDLLLQAPYNWSYVQLNGFNQTIGNLISGTTNPSSAVVENAEFGPAGAATLTVNQTTNSIFSGFMRDGFSGSAPFSLTKNGAATLTLSGNYITYSGSTTVNQGTLVVANLLGNGGNYAGAITDNSSLVFSNSATQTLSGGISGTGVLTMAGSGQTILTGSNSYSGGTVISGTGPLSVAGGTNLGTGTLTFANQGGSLYMTGTNGVFNNAIVLASGSGTTSFNAQQNVSTNTFNGNISGGSSNSVLYLEGGTPGNNTAYTVLNGSNSFLGTINVWRSPLVLGNAFAAGQASILLNANTNPAGDLQFGSGSFSISNNVQLADAGTANLIAVASGQANGISGVVSGNGFTKLGGGTLVLAGNNTFSGGAALNAGTLVFSNAGSQTLSGAVSGVGSLGMAGSGTTILSGANSYSGTTMITNGTLVVGSLGSGSYTNTIADNGTLVVSNSSSQSLSGSISGSGTLTLAGSAMTTLSASNSYSGGTVISGTGGLSVAGGTNLGSGTLTFVTQGSTLNMTGANGVFNNAIVLASGSGTTSFNAQQNVSTNTFNGTISGGSSNSVLYIQGAPTSANTGYTVFNGSNSYQGTTLVWRGPLVLGNANAAGQSLINLFANNNPAGDLQFGNGGFTIANNVALSNGSTANLIGVASGQTNGISGILSSASAGAGLTKVGGGVLTLSGNNTYSGGTVISAGVLQIGNGSTNGTLGAGAVTDNSTLAFNRSDSYLVSNVISGSGGIVQNGSGTTILTGADNNSGSTLINSGTLQVGNGGTTGTIGSGNITNNATLAFNRSDAITVGNSISGSGNFIQAGAGTATITASNNYTGSTTISGGGAIAISSSGSMTGTTNINLGSTNSQGTFDVSAKGASGYTFGTNQQISGNGTITTGVNTGRAVVVNGALNPGNSLGTLAVKGDLTLGSTAQSIFQLGTPGTFASPGLSDLTTVTGKLTLGGALNLQDNAGLNGQGAAGDGVYKLFTYGGTLSGAFSSISAGIVANGALQRSTLITTNAGQVDVVLA